MEQIRYTIIRKRIFNDFWFEIFLTMNHVLNLL